MKRDMANNMYLDKRKMHALLEIHAWLEEEKRGPKWTCFRDPLGRYDGNQDCMLDYLRALTELLEIPCGAALTRNSQCTKCGSTFPPLTHINLEHSHLTLSALVEGQFQAFETDHCPKCCPTIFCEK